MTIDSVLRACARRWYVLLAVLLLTAAAAVAALQTPGVYFARTQVVLLGPPVPARPNKLDSNSAGLIATAGILEREVMAGRTRIPATSPDVTLVDQGVYDGEQVRLPNHGGQWATNFSDPVLDVQASGPTAAIVEQRMNTMIGQITDSLRRRQDEAKVSAGNRITYALSPGAVHVAYLRGKPDRAALVIAVVGVGLGIGLASLIDGFVTRPAPPVGARRSLRLAQKAIP